MKGLKSQPQWVDAPPPIIQEHICYSMVSQIKNLILNHYYIIEPQFNPIPPLLPTQYSTSYQYTNYQLYLVSYIPINHSTITISTTTHPNIYVI